MFYSIRVRYFVTDTSELYQTTVRGATALQMLMSLPTFFATHGIITTLVIWYEIFSSGNSALTQEVTMQNFDFFNPTKLVFGKGTTERIGNEISRNGHRKVLMIAGGGSIRKNGVYDQVDRSLKNAGVDHVESWGVRPNPELEKVREMIAMAKDSGCDAVLSVGGGSVIDSGKSVAAGYFLDNVWDVFESHAPIMEALPHYTVLTISATGSEMNMVAVLTNEAEKKKWAIMGPALYPLVSIVDPSVQTTLPWHQTVNGAVDALSHIMEYYFIGGEAETTLAVNESLSRSIILMTDRLRDNPTDYDCRANLAWAATLAFNGVSGTGLAYGDWASHNIEHGVSAVNPEVAHGAGLGVVFPSWIGYCRDVNPPIFERWAKNIWGAEDIDGGIAAMRSKILSWGNPVTLGGLGVDTALIDEMAALAAKPGGLGSVKKLSESDIREILAASQ